MVVAVLLAWWLYGHVRSAHEVEASDPEVGSAARAHDRATVPGFGEQVARARNGKVPFAAPPSLGGEIEVSGRVLDLYSTAPVSDTEVVLLSAAGESSAITDREGHYKIQVARGMYRAYVRSDAVMSVSRPAQVRIPSAPSADEVEAMDEAGMAVVLATADNAHVDLPVVRSGVIAGRVIDRRGAAIANAVVQAGSEQGLRPVLGTDLAESGADGRFLLRVPVGTAVLSASHPRFAGIDGAPPQLLIAPGSRTSATLTLVSGCIVTGRVVRPDGSPSGDGAIERKWGDDSQFGPDAKITADGTFRWAGFDSGPVTLRAWPWKSPPSPSQTFACRDGAQFHDVVLRLPDEAPALSGVLRQANGEPAALTYLHLEAIDVKAPSQQERSDEHGNFALYNLPPGQYLVQVVSDYGTASREFTVPQAGADITLSGTGSIHGTSGLADGTMQVDVVRCYDVLAAGGLSITRLVPVHAGKFQIDDLPACVLRIVLTFEGHRLAQTVHVEPGQAAALELDTSLLMSQRVTLDPDHEPVPDTDQTPEPGSDNEGGGEGQGDDVGPDDNAAPAMPEPANHLIREPLRTPT